MESHFLSTFPLMQGSYFQMGLGLFTEKLKRNFSRRYTQHSEIYLSYPS